MSKKATVLLRLQHYASAATGGNAYLVEKVTNTTTFTPGDLLGKAEVTVLCTNPAYDVTIIGPERR